MTRGDPNRADEPAAGAVCAGGWREARWALRDPPVHRSRRDDQGDAAERLIAEVRLARKVTHPNVCRILEFGLHRRQGDAVEVIPFLTMELLDGETLASRLRREGVFAPDVALRFLHEIVAGLAAVHQAGIVHRDFKTENVFLVRGEDGTERAVVMDFGLARALDVNRGSSRSSARGLIGTIAYMAPEQVEGQPAPLRRRDADGGGDAAAAQGGTTAVLAAAGAGLRVGRGDRTVPGARSG